MSKTARDDLACHTRAAERRIAGEPLGVRAIAPPVRQGDIAAALWGADHTDADDPSWADWLDYVQTHGSPPTLMKEVKAYLRRADAVLALIGSSQILGERAVATPSDTDIQECAR